MNEFMSANCCYSMVKSNSFGKPASYGINYHDFDIMCYTIEINLTREQLEKRFRARLDEHLPYRKIHRASAFSLPDCPVICSDAPGIIRLKTWGLIPKWVKDEKLASEIRMKTFNARAETLAERASYRHLIRSKKCLVLVNGFYEWQTRGKQKQPYFINLRDKEAFALAGLHDSWTNPVTGEILDTFTVITTRANPMMEIVHNSKKRMPVILPEKEEEVWLDHALPPDKTLSYLKPFDDSLMSAEEADKGLFSKKKDKDTEGRLF